MNRPVPTYEADIQAYKSDSSVSIFWYDKNAAFSADKDAVRTRELLQKNAESVSFYTSKEELCKKVDTTPVDSSIFLVISGIDADDALKDLHQFKQIDTVFVFCRDVAAYTHLKKKYRKITSIFNTHITLQRCIFSNLRRMDQQQDARRLYANSDSFVYPLSISFASKKLFFEKMTTGRIMKDDYTDMINHCHAYYRDNKAVLEEIFEFQRKHVEGMDAVKWYTKAGFLYKSLNRALRSDNVDAIFKFRSIISELSSELTKLHSDFCHVLRDGPYTVYRGLLAPICEIEKLKVNVGGLVGTTQYLSTTRKQSTAEFFAGICPDRNPGEVSIIFEIQIYPCLGDRNSIVTDISRWNWIGEDEILFNLGSVFEVVQVKCKSADKNEWHVILKSGKINVNDTPYFRYLEQRSYELDRMRSDIALGRHLVDMGVLNQIDTYLIECLQISEWNDGCYYDDPQYAFIYDALGRLYALKKRPYEAIAYFTWAFTGFQARHQSVEANEALQFLLKLISELLDPWQVLSIYKKDIIPSDICADAYFRLGMNDEARKMYLELIEILYASDPIDHLRIAEYLTRLGRMDRRGSIFSQALAHFCKVLPEQHPFILEAVNHLKSTEDTIDEPLPWVELSIVHQQRCIKHKFFVQQSDRINDIKVVLQRHFGISCNAQTLRNENGQILANDIDTVADYALNGTAKLHLTIDPEPEPRRVFIESAISTTEIVDVYWWQSVYDIKRYLCDQLKLPPPEQQRLFEAGLELSNDGFCGKLKYPTTRLLLALRNCELKFDSEKRFCIHVYIPLPTENPQWEGPKRHRNHPQDLSNRKQDVFLYDRTVVRFWNILCENTVEDLKAMISKCCAIPVQFQQLSLESTVLTESTATLVSYGVKHNSILNLQLVNVPSKVVFLVQNAHSTDRLTIDSDENIKGLRNHVAKMCASSKHINLEVSDSKLSPNYHSILKVFVNNQHLDDLWEAKLSINVDNSISEAYCGVARLARSDHRKTIEIRLNDCPISFDKLQTLVFDATDIPVSDQRLYADGQLLCSGQKLKSTSLKNLFVLRKQSVDFTVKISVSGHTLLRLSLRSTTTTQDLKRMIKCLRGVPVRQQRLFIGRAELSNPNEIIQTRTSGRRIDVVHAYEKTTFVRYKKRWILFEIDPWENVAKLKARIQSKLSICLDQYLLIHDGVVLRLDIYPFWSIADKSELHLVRSRVHLDYIYVIEHGTKTIAACEWSSVTTVDHVYQAIAQLYSIPTVQPCQISNELGPNSTIYLVRLIALRIIDPEKKSIRNLNIEARKTILELKQELHLDTPVQRKLLFQDKYLSNDEIVGKYDNATILIQSIVSETPNADPFDPLYIKRERHCLDIEELCLRFDGSDEDAVREHAQRRKALKKIITQTKYGDTIE